MDRMRIIAATRIIDIITIRGIITGEEGFLEIIMAEIIVTTKDTGMMITFL